VAGGSVKPARRRGWFIGQRSPPLRRCDELQGRLHAGYRTGSSHLPSDGNCGYKATRRVASADVRGRMRVCAELWNTVFLFNRQVLTCTYHKFFL
jgi:hypothetical protein